MVSHTAWLMDGHQGSRGFTVAQAPWGQCRGLCRDDPRKSTFQGDGRFPSISVFVHLGNYFLTGFSFGLPYLLKSPTSPDRKVCKLFFSSSQGYFLLKMDFWGPPWLSREGLHLPMQGCKFYPSWGPKIPCLKPKKQNIINRSNTLTNSIEAFKMVHIRKKRWTFPSR